MKHHYRAGQITAVIDELLLATLLTAVALATLWELELEAYAMRWLGLPYDGDFEDGELLLSVPHLRNDSVLKTSYAAPVQ